MTIDRTPFKPEFTEFAKDITIQAALGTYDNVVCIIADYHKWIVAKIDQHLQEAKEDETHPRYAFMRKFKVGHVIKFKTSCVNSFPKCNYIISDFKDSYFTAVVRDTGDKFVFQYYIDDFENVRAVDNFGTPPATPMIGFKE